MTALDVKAVIFDLDGLVLDSETTYVSAWQQAAAAMGCRLDDAFCVSLSGLHGLNVERRLQDYLGRDFDVKDFHRLSRAFWTAQVRLQGIPVKKGFFSILRAIDRLGLPFCLATNSRRREAMHCLELAGIRRVFPQSVCRDDVVNGKPAPDVFIEAAKLLGMAAGDCLVLEDSAVGAAAALAAGMPCIYVPSTYPPDKEAAAGALAVLDDLDQVADYILARHQSAV